MFEVFTFELAGGGHGGVLVREIYAIHQDKGNFNNSILYTTLFSDGIGIKGIATELVTAWDMQLELLKQSERADFDLEMELEDDDEGQ